MTLISSVSSAGIYDLTNNLVGLDIRKLNHSDTTIGKAYQSLISQDAYEEYRKTHTEEIAALAKKVEANYKTVQYEKSGDIDTHVDGQSIASEETDIDGMLQTLSASRRGGAVTLGLDPNSVYQFRHNFMDENLSNNAKAMVEALQKNSGIQVMSQLKNSEVSLNSQENICIVGADLLEFMAEHKGSKNIWDGIVAGRYSNLADVDTALQEAGKSETARELRRSSAGRPIDEEIIRGHLTNDMEMYDLGKITLNYTERAARQAYAKAVLTDDVVKTYQDYYYAQKEQSVANLYQQGFKTSASLRYNF